jgi:hypothetical protein
MEQSRFWEDDSRWAGQEILYRLWNPKVHYRVHKSLPLDPILSQFYLVHTLIIYFFKTRFNNNYAPIYTYVSELY